MSDDLLPDARESILHRFVLHCWQVRRLRRWRRLAPRYAQPVQLALRSTTRGPRPLFTTQQQIKPEKQLTSVIIISILTKPRILSHGRKRLVTLSMTVIFTMAIKYWSIPHNLFSWLHVPNPTSGPHTHTCGHNTPVLFSWALLKKKER